MQVSRQDYNANNMINNCIRMRCPSVALPCCCLLFGLQLPPLVQVAVEAAAAEAPEEPEKGRPKKRQKKVTHVTYIVMFQYR